MAADGVAVQSKKKQEEQIRLMTSYHSLFENMPIVYLKQQLIYDSAGKIVDYITVEANPRFEKYFKSMGEVIGKKEVRRIRKVLKGCATSIAWLLPLKRNFLINTITKYR